MGATSQIARDLIPRLRERADLFLYARRPDGVEGGRGYDQFGAEPLDAVLNFVGVGDPARLVRMGAQILDITAQYDGMALDYLRRRPSCRYLFLSSGAVYGGAFTQPAAAETVSIIPVNALGPQDWYAVAKLHAECRHRAMADLSISDIRVFNYFSRSQDLSARFFITDIMRAVMDGAVLKTSAATMMRDFLHPSDFHGLVECLLNVADNGPVDCYSREAVDKFHLLAAMEDRFGLRFETMPGEAGVNATGAKPHYYSVNRRAGGFGYEPRYSALEGVLAEAEAILARTPA